jgi:ribonuclease R
MKILEQKIISLLKKKSKRSFGRRELADLLNLSRGERKLLPKVLRQLQHHQQVEERKGRYRLKQLAKQVEGIFTQADKGYGFLRSDDSAQEDLFIPARHCGSAMDGDRVVASLRYSMRDRRSFGDIVRIVERAHTRLVGQYQLQGRSHVVWPLKRQLGGPFHIKPQANLEPGQVVEVEIERYAEGHQPARGRLLEVLGAVDDPWVDIKTVIRTQSLPHQFSAAALEEALGLASDVPAEEVEGRKDLRGLPFVTIDGETARDFDDAVALQKEGETYRLWVAIADVAHYVTPGSALDSDALERGTSVYFPGFCLPMLPESLSNGICSLRPDEERLTLTAELLFNARGDLLHSTFYPAVIRSQARLTYTQVAAVLDDPEQSLLTQELTAQLLLMAELSVCLTKMRHQRGSLDLEIPEVEVVVDARGQALDLSKVERNQAHRLIEEFMLAANEAVAAFLRDKGWGFLYRIHEPPALEKLEDLQQLAAECGVGLVIAKQGLQRQLQQLLSQVADKPEGRLVNQQLLRSLQQARYSPDNAGHFGLAADCYCHFTSPIRRYPDLIVHRILKLALAGRPQSQGLIRPRLEALGTECSAKERRAMQAERDLVELRRCQLMRERVGEEFSGIISSVTEFGFFVELDDVFVEGLVHVRSLTDDFYSFDPSRMALVGERRRHEFLVGMPIHVVLDKVELWRRRIDFKLLGQ